MGFVHKITANPIESIGFILAAGLVLIGLYIASPLYVISTVGTLAYVFDNGLVRYAIATGYLMAAAPFFISLWRGANTQKFQKLSAFWMFIAFLFITFLRLLSTGPRPFTWVLSLTLALIAAVVHLWTDERTNARN